MGVSASRNVWKKINFCLNYINRRNQVNEIIVDFITCCWQLLAVVEMKSPIRPRVNLSFILEWTIRKENKAEKIQPSLKIHQKPEK